MIVNENFEESKQDCRLSYERNEWEISFRQNDFG